jgi:hypothetical protein
MRLQSFLCLALIGAFSGAAQTADIRFPALGFAYDARSNQIRSLQGIPGAALMGDAVKGDSGFDSVVISPQQNLALAVSRADRRLRLVPLSGAAAQEIPGAMSEPAHIAFSPSGLAAVVWSREIQVLTDLASGPRVANLDSAFAEMPEAIAISDDGRELLAFSGRDTAYVWLLNSNGGATQMPLPGSVAAVAFRRHSHDAVAVTRSGDVYLIRNAGPTSEIRQVYTGDEQTSDPVAVQVSSDGTRAYAANRRGMIAVIDLQSGSAAAVSCSCSPAGLEPLNSSALFRLTEISDRPLMLFDASTPTPRIWFVPSDAATQRSAQ